MPEDGRTPSLPGPDAVRRLLADAGYRLGFREGGFWECLASRGDERWLGRGLDAEEAVADCVGQMLPSALAQHLLARSLGPTLVTPEARVDAALEAPRPAEPPPHDPEPRTEPRTEARTERADTPELVDPGPLPAHLRPTHLALSPRAEPEAVAVQPLPATAPEPSHTQPRLKTSAAPPPPPLPTRRFDEDIVELEVLDERLRALLPELAGFSRELQRLGFIAFIARARHIAARSGDARVEQLVRRIAGRLGELAQQFWPGSVRALQIRATPLQAGDDMGLPHGGKLHDWAEAAEAAERIIEERREALERDRLDEWGWADADRCQPSPNDPEARLEQVRGAMEKFFGRLDMPTSSDADRELQTAADKHIPELLRWARELRWLRPHVEDRVRWGQAMGRLRWAVTRLPREARLPLDLALDEMHRPTKPWATELGEDPVAKLKKKARKELLQKRIEGERATPDQIADWLSRAFELGDAFTTSEIAERIPDWFDAVLALPEDAPDKDRKFRRRLKLLQEEILRMRGGSEVAVTTDGEAESPETEATDPDEGDLAFRRLLGRVREKVEGKSALFVSNRADPLLKEKLERELGLELEWAEIDPRRIQARIESVKQGSFEMVLSATGFQGHSIDATLGRATTACGLPYVRVNRGRLITCVRALARQFGLLEAA